MKNRLPFARHIPPFIACAIGIGFILAPVVSGQVSDGFAPDVHGEVYAIALQPDGQIVIGGNFSAVSGITRSNLARLNSSGALDTSFNPQANGTVLALAMLEDGKILVGGAFTSIRDQPRYRLARLNSNGSLDFGFNPGATGDYATVTSLTLQPDGRLLVGGTFDGLGGHPWANLACLNHDGTLTPTSVPEPMAGSGCVAVQSDGKILVGGDFSTIGGQPGPSLVRLSINGALDPSFTPQMDYLTNVAYGPNCLLVQPDGKILVAGVFTAPGGVARNFVRRLNPDGSADTAFYQSDYTGPFHPTPRSVFSLALQCDGGILVAGDFALLAGHDHASLGRLNPDGTFDATFDPSITFEPNPLVPVYAVASLAVQADGAILAGGNFSGLGGQTGAGFGRLTNGAAAARSLVVNATGTIATWTRPGAAPRTAASQLR